MDFEAADTPELRAWRGEVRDFLERALPGGMHFDYDYDEDPERWEKYLAFWREVGRKGWIALTWPKEYYGLGETAIKRWILWDEFINYDAPTYPVIGLQVGALILRLGTHEQRLRHLKGIAEVTTLWGEGYSEPNAGSDLAALTTRARRDGDGWIIDGQKTLGTAVHQCQWMSVLARTDMNVKAHSGLTCFLVPLDADGISISPLENIAGGRQNHTFFDGVRVSAENVLGDVNKAWTQVWFGMGGEQLDPAGPPPETFPLRIVGMLNQVIDYCRETRRGGVLLSEDPVIRLQLAELTMAVEALRLESYEAFSMATGSSPAGGRGSAHNLAHAYWKELWPRLAQICMEIGGPLAQLRSGRWAQLEGRIQHHFLGSFGNHAGGTSQLKRMGLATRGLGLPR